MFSFLKPKTYKPKPERLDSICEVVTAMAEKLHNVVAYMDPEYDPDYNPGHVRLQDIPELTTDDAFSLSQAEVDKKVAERQSQLVGCTEFVRSELKIWSDYLAKTKVLWPEVASGLRDMEIYIQYGFEWCQVEADFFRYNHDATNSTSIQKFENKARRVREIAAKWDAQQPKMLDVFDNLFEWLKKAGAR